MNKICDGDFCKRVLLVTDKLQSPFVLPDTSKEQSRENESDF